MNENDNSFSRSGQRLAVRWLTRYFRQPAKISDIRGECEGTKGADDARRARRLFSSSIRNLRLYRETFSRFASRKPAPEVEAALILALSEVDLDKRGRTPAIIDSWVGLIRKNGGKRTAGFANAVLRKAAAHLTQVRSGVLQLPPGVLHSHPDWLVERWSRDFGVRETLRMLEWNQKQPDIYAAGDPASQIEVDSLERTRWPGFYRLSSGITPEIQELLDIGRLTIRDPATRIATDLLCSEKPGTVLDMCASPGGKSRSLLSRLDDGPEKLIAADLADRLPILVQNLSPWRERAEICAIDFEAPETFPDHWNRHFDAVLLDAPCSNSGVIQRKPDVKWRLNPADMKRMPVMQLAFLKAASTFVRNGGALVYSSCSIESAENRMVVDQFLHSPEGQPFRLTAAIRAIPTRTGHDGAGVFRLKHKP